jgi:glyoxylase-like metal-dependent hydrolase (beta-lactamase superfamily II)
MPVEFRIISIGTLSRNSFWGENAPVRTPHATTTLILSGKEKILVDPALPGQILNARLFERAGIKNSDITMVFLTSFRAAHRGGLAAFDKATWYLHEPEKKYVRKVLEEMYRRSGSDTCQCKDPHHEHGDHHDHESDRSLIAMDLELLDRCKPAPERLAEQVEIFPSPGATPGCCGLLLTPPVGATMIAGDAVINTEYLEHGKVWDDCYDLKAAQQSLQDILEVAEVIVPGHDNMIPLLGKLL